MPKCACNNRRTHITGGSPTQNIVTYSDEDTRPRNSSTTSSNPTLGTKSNVPNKLLKAILIGDSSVGKTALLFRLTDGGFIEAFRSSIGVDFKIKEFQIESRKARLQLWDTAGQERFRSLTKAYYHGTDGVILLYDITSLESFNHLKDWIKEAKETTPPHATFMLIGNKGDLENQRMIKTEQAEQFAQQNGIHLTAEVSVKENEQNLDSLFIEFVKSIEKNIMVKSNLS